MPINPRRPEKKSHILAGMGASKPPSVGTPLKLMVPDDPRYVSVLTTMEMGFSSFKIPEIRYLSKPLLDASKW
jgi:hypothetical protein